MSNRPRCITRRVDTRKQNTVDIILNVFGLVVAAYETNPLVFGHFEYVNSSSLAYPFLTLPLNSLSWHLSPSKGLHTETFEAILKQAAMT
jgi:hypothetical protein